MNASKILEAHNNVGLGVFESGTGEPLVFLHGTAAKADRWASVSNILDEKFRCLTYDRRGRGSSSDAAHYSLNDEIDDLRRVIDHAGDGQPVDVVAHSFGALIAIAALIQEPRMFRRLVVYEAPLAFPKRCEFIDVNRVSELEQVLERDGSDIATVFFLEHFPKATKAEIDQLKSSPSWTERTRVAATIARELRAAHDFALDPATLQDRPTPCLILLGGDSPPPFHISAQVLQEGLPHSKLVELPGERHRAMDTMPESVAQHIIGFLRD